MKSLTIGKVLVFLVSIRVNKQKVSMKVSTQEFSYWSEVPNIVSMDSHKKSTYHFYSDLKSKIFCSIKESSDSFSRRSWSLEMTLIRRVLIFQSLWACWFGMEILMGLIYALRTVGWTVLSYIWMRWIRNLI